MLYSFILYILYISVFNRCSLVTVSPVDQATVTEQSAYMLFYAKEGSGWFETAAVISASSSFYY